MELLMKNNHGRYFGIIGQTKFTKTECCFILMGKFRPFRMAGIQNCSIPVTISFTRMNEKGMSKT